jgi:hypothetical protein
MAEYEEITFDEELRRVNEQVPFHSFIIKLSSGDRYRITNPAWLAVGAHVVSYMHPTRGETFFRKNQMVGVDVPLKETVK